MDESKKYFQNLDSIRFVAAVMVFLNHAMQPCYAYLPIRGTFWERLLLSISNGQQGVSVFFVLSGFLITYLLIEEHTKYGKVYLLHFYLRRLLRIWPLYFFVVFFTFILYPFLKSRIGIPIPKGANIYYHLSFLSNFDMIDRVKHDIGTHIMSQDINWSVSVEEQFYVFWPLLFVFLPRIAWPFVIIALIVASVLFRLVYFDDPVILYFHTVALLVDLGFGALLAILIHQFPSIRFFFENISFKAHSIIILLIVVLLLWNDRIFDFGYGNAVGRIVVSFSFALFIAAQAMILNNSILNLSNWCFARRWGKYTYGIYLLHPIAMTILDIFYRLTHIPKEGFWPLFMMGVVTFLLTLLLSKLSYEHFESKFLRIKRRWEK